MLTVLVIQLIYCTNHWTRCNFVQVEYTNPSHVKGPSSQGTYKHLDIVQYTHAKTQTTARKWRGSSQEAKLSRAMIPDRQTHGGLRRSTVIWSAWSTANLAILLSARVAPALQIYLERGNLLLRAFDSTKKKSGNDGDCQQSR